MRNLAYIARTHMINARHWHNMVITSNEQVTTLKSAHAVIIS